MVRVLACSPCSCGLGGALRPKMFSLVGELKFVCVQTVSGKNVLSDSVQPKKPQPGLFPLVALDGAKSVLALVFPFLALVCYGLC